MGSAGESTAFLPPIVLRITCPPLILISRFDLFPSRSVVPPLPLFPLLLLSPTNPPTLSLSILSIFLVHVVGLLAIFFPQDGLRKCLGTMRYRQMRYIDTASGGIYYFACSRYGSMSADRRPEKEEKREREFDVTVTTLNKIFTANRFSRG